MRGWLVILTSGLACASSARPTAPTAPTATGSAAGSGGAGATTCEGVRPRVEALYRGEARRNEPTRVEEAVSDNTTMVMNDCTKDPARRVPCLAGAATVAALETSCLAPLDDEGTEGDRK